MVGVKLQYEKSIMGIVGDSNCSHIVEHRKKKSPHRESKNYVVCAPIDFNLILGAKRGN